MPLPASVQQGSGMLPVTQSFSVSVTGAHDPALEAGVRRFVAQLSRQTGIPFRPKAGAAATLTVHADKALEAVQKLGEDESYQLTVTDSGAQLTAPTTLGVLTRLADISTAGRRSRRVDSPRPQSRSKISRAFPGAAC